MKPPPLPAIFQVLKPKNGLGRSLAGALPMGLLSVTLALAMLLWNGMGEQLGRVEDRVEQIQVDYRRTIVLEARLEYQDRLLQDIQARLDTLSRLLIQDRLTASNPKQSCPDVHAWVPGVPEGLETAEGCD